MRSWWRYEQQFIRMAMATLMHHSFGPMHTVSGAPRGQKTATTARREESNEMNDAMPRSVAFFQMYDEEDAEPWLRPPCQGEPPDRLTRSSEAPRLVPLMGEGRGRWLLSCSWRRQQSGCEMSSHSPSCGMVTGLIMMPWNSPLCRSLQHRLTTFPLTAVRSLDVSLVRATPP